MTGLDRRPAAATDATLPRGPLAGFAAGSLGMGVWVTVPGLLLLYFLTDVLAVGPWLAGLALLLPKIADVLLHPGWGTAPTSSRPDAATVVACCCSAAPCRSRSPRSSRCPAA